MKKVLSVFKSILVFVSAYVIVFLGMVCVIRYIDGQRNIDAFIPIYTEEELLALSLILGYSLVFVLPVSMLANYKYKGRKYIYINSLSISISSLITFGILIKLFVDKPIEKASEVGLMLMILWFVTGLIVFSYWNRLTKRST